jgi:quercetin dioxygenase-like cupin family protein
VAPAVRIHRDRRRVAYCDVFEGLPGDVNVFLMEAHKPSGWHRHQRQTDQFFVARGTVVFGTWSVGEDPRYATLHVGDRYKIGPGIWHGYSAPVESVLCMYLDQKYNPDDEEATSFDAVPWSP